MANNSDTMIEGLKSLLRNVADLKLTPDADMQFLAGLESSIIGYVKAAGQQSINGALGQSAPQGGMATPGGMGDATMGMSDMGPQQIAPGGGAGMSGLAPQAMNGDELRRILQPPTG